MTAEELIRLFNDHYDKHGIKKPIKSPYPVDAETYGQVCSSILKNKANMGPERIFGKGVVLIDIGPNNGVLFKGIELLIKSQ